MTDNKPASRRKRALFALAIVAAAIGAFAALVMSRPQPATADIPERAWNVQTETAAIGMHAPTLLLYGRVRSPSHSQLRSAVEADVAQVLVQDGDAVEKDQLLVELDGREARYRLQQRQAELAEIDALIDAENKRHANDEAALEQETELLALAERAVARARQLQDRSLGSQSQLDEAQQNLAQRRLTVANRRYNLDEHPARLAQLKARREQAASRLDLARLDLARTQLRAPFGGRVAAVSAAPGQRVRPGDSLVELYDDNDLEVRAQIPASQLAAVRQTLRTDDPVRAVGTLDGEPVQLQLARLAASVAKGQGGIDAYFSVTASNHSPHLGRIMELLVTLPAVPDTLAIPREALYGTDRIYKVSESRLASVPVKLVGEARELSGAGRLLVKAPDVRAGDQILVTKFANAMHGLRVNAERAPE